MPASSAVSPPARPRRADAVSNRQLVVAAAARVFAEHGVEASVGAVAERAGVGKATVYRNFPTKEHLISAVAVERVRSIEQLAAEAATRPDAWGAFCELLERIAEARARDRIMLEALELQGHVEELAAARAAAHRALERLMDRAKRQGRMRPDATVKDIRVLFAGLIHGMSDEQRDDAPAWRRYGALIANALRADEA